MKFCWMHRSALSWAKDSRARVPRWTERHLLRCDSCRCHHERETTLIEALTDGAGAPRPEFPPFLHGRIMAAIETEPPKAQLGPIIPWIRAWMIPALGVLLISAYSVWKAQQATSPVQGRLPPPVAGRQILAQRSSQRMVAWMENLDQPLETEIHFVVSDAKVAFQSLAANFVPERDF